MSRIIRDPIKRQLDEAEGYLMLNLPRKAIEILERRADWATMQFEASFLSGEALRSLERYREALKPLEVAARPAAGRHRRRHCPRLVLQAHSTPCAGDRLAGAGRHGINSKEPQPLLHYNLACYWSLAGNPSKAARRAARGARPRSRAPFAHPR